MSHDDYDGASTAQKTAVGSWRIASNALNALARETETESRNEPIKEVK